MKVGTSYLVISLRQLGHLCGQKKKFMLVVYEHF